MKLMRVGILSSGRGTHLPPLVAAIKQEALPVEIPLVISNKAHAPILQKADELKIKNIHIPAENESLISSAFKAEKIDLIILLGYMRILSAEFVQAWEHKIVNLHPSLLPAYSGMMDLKVHQAVIASGEGRSGCTLHYVTTDVDAGPIILQKECEVYADDTPETLKSRVQVLEVQALKEFLGITSQGNGVTSHINNLVPHLKNECGDGEPNC